MPYQDAAAARAALNTVRSNITHIDSLIDTAVSEGNEFIIVSPNIFTENMVTTLQNKGYNVTTKQDSMGSYKEYKISW